jgi:hypothetical protein
MPFLSETPFSVSSPKSTNFCAERSPRRDPMVVLAGDAPHDKDRVRSFHYTEKGQYVVNPVTD